VLIDAFTFNNELELLEIRLNELDSIVDRFVIVESMESHGSSYRKPAAVLSENWNVVRPFLNKIVYLVLANLMPPLENTDCIWPRENFHRNALMPEILGVSTSPNDIVMISDCDEIPRAKTVWEHLGKFQHGLHALNQDFFYYDVNNNVGKWNGTVVGTVAAIQNAGGPQAVRLKRDSVPSIPNAGWHLSYFGSLENIRSKVANFAHSNDTTSKEFLVRDNKEIVSDILSGKDLFHRGSEGRRDYWQSNDPRLPVHFLNNQEKYKLFTEEGLREVLCPAI